MDEIEQNPRDLLQKGVVFHKQNQFKRAQAIYEQILKTHDDHFEALQLLGTLQAQVGNYEQALTTLNRALQIDPNNVLCQLNHGTLLQDLNRYEEAIVSYERAIAIDPYCAEAYKNRGIALRTLGRFEEALASYKSAIAIDPKSAATHINLATQMLLLGNYQTAWPEYEWRWKIPQLSASKHYRNLPQPLWLGNHPLEGKTILLHAEQGLGDTLQFCRYVPLVAQLGAKVILEVQAPLVHLLKDLEGVNTLIARGDALPAFDYQCPLMSLPLAFQTTLESIPSDTPYLHAMPHKVDAWEQRLGVKTQLRVGLVWNGGHRQEQPELWNVNQRRNLPLEQIARLQSLDMEFYSLQKGNPAESELKAKQASVWPSIINYANDLKDFTDTAALMQCMDLIISVDTSCAHLAGALGKPVWILNRFDSCWRWLLEREDSPWYPTAKLYRQKTPGDWDGVIERVARDLGGLDSTLQAQQHQAGVRSVRNFEKEHIAHLYKNGLSLHQQGKYDEAQAVYEEILQIDTEHFDALQLLGALFVQTNQYSQALNYLECALQLRPEYVEALSNRGNALKALGRFEDALASYDRAIGINPDFAIAHYNRATLLQDSGLLVEALHSYDQAIHIQPGYAQAFNNRGNTLKELGRFDQASISFSQCLALNPNNAGAQWNSSCLLLLMGDFESGWKGHEWRWHHEKIPSSKDKRNFPQPLWLGNYPLQGKTILLHAEQGLGDTLQFCRYVPLVAQLGAKVILEVQAPLIGLLKDLEGVNTLIARGDALPAFDYQCPLMSLPLAFQTTLESIPAATPYLSANPHRVRVWQDRLGPKTKPRVGLVWNGGHRQDQPELWNVNQRRNLPLEKIARLQSLDMEFYSLQKGDPAESELKQKQAAVWPTLMNYADDLKDFTDTAALMQCMDLIISVDTSCAHLAGALGKPVWILNRFDSCWRWLLEREDSPWYPTAKLYRQKTPGDWDGVIERVAMDLGGLDSTLQAQQHQAGYSMAILESCLLKNPVSKGT